MNLKSNNKNLYPVYDPGFRPAVVENRQFLREVQNTGGGVPLKIAIERQDGHTSVYETRVFSEGNDMDCKNFFYTERLVKSLLWVHGGWRIAIGGPQNIGQYIKECYMPGGLREFDAGFMSRVYEKPFTVDVTEVDKVPGAYEKPKPLGRHLNGCRIGFDAGGSDLKVSAVVEGRVIYSEEIVWNPKLKDDPDYHYHHIIGAMKKAAGYLPRVDAIGVSSAGIYINNRVMVASLFIQVSDDIFDQKVKDIFLRASEELGNVAIEVANDGDVTALAGAMDLNDSNVLGIAMGTSEAGGYVDSKGQITGWLNELAFIPVDFNPDAMVDEWSGDFGCGVKYFSQDGVIKLAGYAEIDLAQYATPAEKLKAVQRLLEDGDERAKRIFEDIGCCLGYALAHYSDFYDMKHVLILGRVTSGSGGELIQYNAQQVICNQFPELAGKITLHLPDESSRRVGQSIAAASLPEIIKDL